MTGKRIPLPPQDVLRATYAYDPATGVLTERLTGRVVQAVYGGLSAARIRFGDIRVSLNRVIWKWCFGEEPAVVFPADNDMANHKIANLRACSSDAEFKRIRYKRGARRLPEKRPVRANNASGIEGVWWKEDVQRWLWGGLVNGRRVQRKFRTKEEAMAAAEAFAREGTRAIPGYSVAPVGASGARGVGFRSRYGTWYARVHRGDKAIHIGTFATKEEAIAAREAWDREHGA